MRRDKKSCSSCKFQMTGFDGGFFGLPLTCECKIYGETENRKNCSKFEKKITKDDLFYKIRELEKENEQLKADHKRQQNQIKLLNKRLGQIPPKIREVWFE